jgi:transglutaminase-like putative cysteine protease
MLLTGHPISAFLCTTRYLDHDDARIGALVDTRRWRAETAVEGARAAFEFVRDEIPHSWDLKSHRVTRTASEVLAHGEGLCYAKAHLLTAILRHLRVPSGLAYQHLTFGDTRETGYSVHGLSTAFLEGRWIRLDARGNKAGVDAQFSLAAERLAFAVRAEIEERDYEENFCDVHPTIARTLESEDDLHVLVKRLPEVL